MKRFLPLTGLVLVGVALFIGSLMFTRAQRPSIPAQWQHLTRGMTPLDLRSAVQDDVYDLRVLQGFDVVTHMGKFGHWQMIVRYDSTGRVVSATASYIHTFGFGFLNTPGIKVL